MKKSITKPQKSAGFLYRGSFYVYSLKELQALREASKSAKQQLSAFVLSSALRAAEEAKTADRSPSA